MTKITISLMMLFMTIMMIFLTHPLSIGLMILLQTLLMCLLSGMLIKTYWFSYILFLTFLGGLLVLFIYVSSIASNEMFNFSFNTKMFITFSLMTLFMTQFYFFFVENLNWMNLSNNINDTDNLLKMMFFNNENNTNINKLYNNHTYMMMMMLIIYLFVSLVAVVKITNIFYGPLRSI